MAGQVPAVALDGQSTASAIERLTEFVRDQESLPLHSHVLLTNIGIINGNTIVSHKLGRVPRGMIPVRLRTLHDNPLYVSAWDANTMTVVGALTDTVDLLVF